MSTTYTVLVGQEITLNPQLTVPVLQSYWNLPFGQIAGGYTFSSELGQLFNASPLIAAQERPTFYFSAPGTYVITGWSILMDGTIANARPTTFVVVMPIASLDVEFTGAPGYYQNPGRVALGTSDPNAYGIVYTGTVTNPSPLYSIEIGLLQLVQPSRVLTIDTGGIQPCPANGHWLCDTTNANDPIYNSVRVPIGPLATGSLPLVGDRPSIGTELGLGQPTNILISQESFQTYLMYRVTGQGNSIWFPLRRSTWQWSVSASRDQNGNWTAVGPAWFRANDWAHDYPVWVGYVGIPLHLQWGDWEEVARARSV